MSGYYDLATPFYQTELDLARLGSNPNVKVHNYASGHMSYLDDAARKLQRDDMVALYNSESVAK
jgi:carboxypeptidase C (cathepsin A)